VVAFKAMLAVSEQEAAESDACRLEEQIALSEEYYKSLVEQVELARSYNHDMHYHMETLNGLSAAGDLNGMQQYVADMGKDLPGSLPTQYCTVGALNALLGRYADTCKQENIQLRCQLNIPANTGVHPIHLCVIFGNALQNAIEAVEKLPPEMERWIEAKANQREGRMAIQVTNPCPERPNINNGHVKTTKQESGHGMGLENVRTAAQRYNGWSGASWENGIFALNVELNDV
jgi:sensor histidine kinase regulating citrate/malate metabolism